MTQRTPLTVREKERIYDLKVAGHSLSAIANLVDCSHDCARKWWRVGRDRGREALKAPRRSRQTAGILSQFSANVRQAALEMKQANRRWGPERVLIELKSNPFLRNERLPSASRLAVYFKHACPDCVNAYKKKATCPVRPPVASQVHEVWQMDAQENHRLGDGQVATVCSIRDPFAAAVIATDAFSVKTTRHYRKLTVDELRNLLRQGFERWQTLPAAVQTDNDTHFAGRTDDPFPPVFTLWLAGLGIEHRLSRPRQPTDQAQIERQHHTLDAWTDNVAHRATLVTFRHALQKELTVHNEQFPSRASRCQRQSPLTAFPQLQQPRRPYKREYEPYLFSLIRMFNYLATKQFSRRVTKTGQIRLGRIRYAIGRKFAGCEVVIRLDPATKEWCFYNSDNNEEWARRSVKGLDFQTITGLDPAQTRQPKTPIQLALPIAV